MVYHGRVSLQMRYYLLLVLITLGTHAAASITAALYVSYAWPRLRRLVDPQPAAARARTLAVARLLPVGVGMIAALVVASVFVRYEPRGTTEGAGLLLVAFAATSVLLAAVALRRASDAWRASLLCARLVRQCGRRSERGDGQAVWILDTPYPVAAVTGVFRTRLLLSTRIVQECTPSELDAVIRHEAAHVRRHDNLVRAAMRGLPDPLAMMPAGRDLQNAWAAAAEEAADDEAAGAQAESRTELAAALVRVARMADGPPPGWMPALAFYEGTNLEHRVRRLLSAGSGARAATAGRLAAFAAAAVCAALLVTDSVSRELHGLMELAVRHLP